MKLLPSQCILCTPYNPVPCHLMQSHICKVHVCLAVTCHLHFWQNDRGLLGATAVTLGWNRYRVSTESKLQTLVYDILPSTTAVFSYAIGSRKLSANVQFFVGAETVVPLLQTTQIISDVCFITGHVANASSDKTKII